MLSCNNCYLVIIVIPIRAKVNVNQDVYLGFLISNKEDKKMKHK
jgi:hypothetical protein